MDTRGAAATVAWRERDRHASSDHGTGPGKEEEVEWRLCTVVGLSDCDHFFTGESVGREGPFKRDGMTRRSRGMKWHVVEVRVHPITISGPDSFSGWSVMLKASNRKSKPRKWTQGVENM
ncbi:hypothetical protein CRG98_021732 [Punica granatum]|uniref:Uncharacterized protein n=1 Tax=Punica granatum TaxID=22663 RepID=A0A2I0JPR5_PUNGR|nr:hypothetical protein CRG98_021732 [Punica granatum]